jgi:FAD/FMN-containing dehydrogenase/Fe-S oxidoreductase
MIAESEIISPAQSQDLEAALRRKIEGEVRFDDGSRALYATDLSMYRHVPIGVVIPRSVIYAVRICREHNVPVLNRGCGSSLAGQTCNVAVVIDFSKYLNRILELDPGNHYAWVQPGVICDTLRDAAEEYSQTFAPDPATHQYCTLGGMIGNNSCGAHTVMGGKTAENVEELDILTYDGVRMTVGATSERELEKIIRKGGRRGEIYSKLLAIRDKYSDLIRHRFPKIPRRVSGYNLDQLLAENHFHVARALVGTEGTCVTVLRAKVRLMHSPPAKAMIVLAYNDIFHAADHAAELRELGPIALEALQKHVIENEIKKGKELRGAKYLPDADTWVLVEFGGHTPSEAAGQASAAMEKIRSKDRDHIAMRLLTDNAEQKEVWHVRESGVGASRLPGEEDAWPSWEDSAVAPEKLGQYLREFYKLVGKFGYKMTIFGHFGDGCMHTRITFNPKTVDGVKHYRDFITEAAHLVVRFGGSLSGEHGDGQARAEMLPVMFGSELVQGFREFKSAWDPHWRMNPGKIVDPYPLDQNLRFGPDYAPKPVLTWFKFPEDQGSMALATERCFGVGKCRSLDGATMCPSFQVTREEMHSTRGRAHLLNEMLRGDALGGGWKDEHVKDALDLCLSCKGCKHDCPVSVDMATYKAEFLSHYYQGRPRPVTSYAFGMIDRWAAIGSKAPAIANLFAQTPGLAQLAKSFAGVTQHRPIPVLAPHTFKDWFAKRGHNRRNPGYRKVILWADTFNNYFLPHTAQAAVEVLEDAGYSVEVPRQHLCCGRPLYDYGMLAEAKGYLENILTALKPAILAGTPVVFLEPGCASVFRDELPNLMAHSEDAIRLSKQTLLLSELLTRDGYRAPALKRKALVHMHCHHKSLFKDHAEQELIRRMGLDAEVLDSGCCGMAGSFGYEERHYDISMKIGERVLLPRVRSASHDTLIIANGFSCREQIQQGTPRHAMHIAEVFQMALHRPEVPSKGYSEAATSRA